MRRVARRAVVPHRGRRGRAPRWRRGTLQVSLVVIVLTLHVRRPATGAAVLLGSVGVIRTSGVRRGHRLGVLVVHIRTLLGGHGSLLHVGALGTGGDHVHLHGNLHVPLGRVLDHLRLLHVNLLRVLRHMLRHLLEGLELLLLGLLLLRHQIHGVTAGVHLHLHLHRRAHACSAHILQLHHGRVHHSCIHLVGCEFYGNIGAVLQEHLLLVHEPVNRPEV